MVIVWKLQIGELFWIMFRCINILHHSELHNLLNGNRPERSHSWHSWRRNLVARSLTAIQPGDILIANHQLQIIDPSNIQSGRNFDRKPPIAKEDFSYHWSTSNAPICPSLFGHIQDPHNPCMYEWKLGEVETNNWWLSTGRRRYSEVMLSGSISRWSLQLWYYCNILYDI